MKTSNQLHIHFMGICGSGCASIAMLAYSAGFKVSGCDQSDESYYANELKRRNIKIYIGHSEEHINDDVDIVAVSPAIFDINPDSLELQEAKRRGILMTWQEFMGKYLQNNKRVIAISGTHGKTTTTFLTAELLIDAGLDPNVMGGSVYKKWGSGARSGSSDLFLCEADEFNRNFHYYYPEIAVVNNVEMDHPECYNSYDEVIDSFTHFLTHGNQLKTLIINADSEGAVSVLKKAFCFDSFKEVQVYAFTRRDETDLSEFSRDIIKVLYRTEEKRSEGTTFVTEYEGKKHRFFMNLYGDYNVSNAVVATTIAQLLGISDDIIQRSIAKFEGVGRRFDKVGEMRNVPVFDDYAHHPTEIRAVLEMVKDYFPKKKIVAVFEPHQISRLRLMREEYINALLIADYIIIAKTHLGREAHKNMEPITGKEWRDASNRFIYQEDNIKIKEEVEKMIDSQKCDVVIVIGAANSYKISRLLCETRK